MKVFNIGFLATLMLAVSLFLTACGGDTTNNITATEVTSADPKVELVIKGGISLAYTSTEKPLQQEIENFLNTTVILKDGQHVSGILVYASRDDTSDIMEDEQKYVFHKVDSINGKFFYNPIWDTKNLPKLFQTKDFEYTLHDIAVVVDQQTFSEGKLTVLEGEILKESVFIYNEETQKLFDGVSSSIDFDGDEKSFSAELPPGYYTLYASQIDTVVDIVGVEENIDNGGLDNHGEKHTFYHNGGKIEFKVHGFWDTIGSFNFKLEKANEEDSLNALIKSIEG